jgi:hypothetical protein
MRKEKLRVATKIVSYRVDDEMIVRFEVEPTEGFQPAAPGQILGQVADAVEPAIEAAKIIIDKIRETLPNEVEVKFGVKVSGGSDWFVAKTAAEASFEITVTWRRGGGATGQGTM